MASMNTRLNIEKLDGNIVQRHGGSKQVGFKQHGLGVKTGVHGVHDEKLAQRRLEDKQPEEKTNTDCLVKEQDKEYQTGRKIKTDNVFDSCNERSTQQCQKSGVAKHLGVVGIHQQNGLVDETNVTLFAKEDHTFEMEPHGNVDHVDGSHEVQTHDLMDYQLACDREQHLAYELFGYREDSNEAAFVMCMCSTTVARNAVTIAMAITGDKHQTLLEGHSILSLEGSLSGDWDVEKNGYGLMILGCARSLKANLQHMKARSTTEAGCMTFTDAWKKEIWLKGLLSESRYEL
nr:zinc finger, CCHC-type [Tanacetum cinerariifolium]